MPTHVHAVVSTPAEGGYSLAALALCSFLADWLLACCPLHAACLHTCMLASTHMHALCCLNTASVNAGALLIKPSSNVTPVVTALQKADLWSCGVVLYALLYGRYPFDAENKYYVRKIVAAEYVIPQDIPVSSECKHLLQGLLVADPEKRMSIQEMLTQPWLCQDLPEGALEMNHTYLAYPLSLHQVGGMCLNGAVHPTLLSC